MYVWINADIKGTDQQNAIESAFLLALTDEVTAAKRSSSCTIFMRQRTRNCRPTLPTHF
jgi:hypothetical protein